MLSLKDVTTAIGKKKIIHNISFTLKKGEVLALLGHNGAGKSTLMKTILGTLRKESGTIIAQETIDQDVNLERYTRCFSYLPEELLLFTELTVMQHFQLYGLSYRVG